MSDVMWYAASFSMDDSIAKLTFFKTDLDLVDQQNLLVSWIGTEIRSPVVIFFSSRVRILSMKLPTCEIDIELAWSTMEKGYPFIGSHEQLHEKISN